jgi:hypothetical protein
VCRVLWCGAVRCRVVWCRVVWCGVVSCGVVWCGVVRCGAVWCGAVWCGAVWCRVVSCRVIVLQTVALRAAAKAKEEVDEGGVTWEYDSALPKPAAQQGPKALRWKRFDPTTEMTIEAAFQANTNIVTLSSATWLLGEEFVRYVRKSR